MSTSHPHIGATPEADAAEGRGAWHARAEAEDFPFTLRELRNHLDRLGYRAQTGQVGGEDVRDMQARVAAFRDSLEHRARRDPPEQDGSQNDEEHAARTRYYERRIQAALADMAAQLGDKSWADNAPPGLDVASRAWLDQRFAALRGQLEEALTQQTPSASADAALEDARERLNAMERKLADSVERQQQANDKILSMVDARIREAIAPDDGPRLETLDTRLQSLQHGFDRAMSELESMKKGTQRLAIRASATVARQTAKATAHHVAKAVREAAPEHRFARLEEGLNGCMDETRTLRHEAGVIQQTLEDGLEDLRGRINELTLITRKVLTPQPAAAGEAAGASGWSAPLPEKRSPSPQRRSGHVSRPRLSEQTTRSAPARSGSSLISRLGLAVVVALLIAASFAMLYAQLSGGGWRLPAITDRQQAPTSTSKADKKEPTPARNETEGRVILPGIILAGDGSQQV
ncbi:hypothetical protein [Dichotomicrobium thermohalophilum]|uniref:Uncharacterized protein n=1 Tax=Dichotomicrobium thermohalophilum TaxID=933063 RepID=A0A397Q738_9HYPH|nr:hypothetical protein [Dichotomicrobium thermohalophilum]RIA55337.1 hypothetical protein BXY53_0398 [Dichotomicrobium thermohalophilum]